MSVVEAQYLQTPLVWVSHNAHVRSVLSYVQSKADANKLNPRFHLFIHRSKMCNEVALSALLIESSTWIVSSRCPPSTDGSCRAHGRMSRIAHVR